MRNIRKSGLSSVFGVATAKYNNNAIGGNLEIPFLADNDKDLRI